MRSALAGVVAVAVGLGVGELMAGVLPGAPSLVVAVGQGVIAVVPRPVEEFAISVFGVWDKAALVVGIVGTSLLLGALLGLAARTRPWLGALGLVAFGVVGCNAALERPDVVATQALAAAGAATLADLAALAALLRQSAGPSPDRRRFLMTAGVLLASAAGAAALGRDLAARYRASWFARDFVKLPPPAAPAPPAPTGWALPGLTPLHTPNETFYRVDMALEVPHVDPATWRLAVKGLVDRPFELTYDEILGMPLVEADVTLVCVSNAVGDDLVGNARWLGVPLDGLLRRAGVRTEATQIVGRSVDDFTAGFPTEAAFDGRGALVAVGMNGEPLPYEHGFPARLVVPGLYGYLSATKWLSAIELTTWEGFDGWWIPRGWAKKAPVKTASRIDVPRAGKRISPGPQPIAGVAWAPSRGIGRVQVQVDDGPWREATLGASLGRNSWRPWRLDWQAEPGEHTLRVRAADGAGELQTDAIHRPAPDGATGWHTVTVTVG